MVQVTTETISYLSGTDLYCSPTCVQSKILTLQCTITVCYKGLRFDIVECGRSSLGINYNYSGVVLTQAHSVVNGRPFWAHHHTGNSNEMEEEILFCSVG